MSKDIPRLEFDELRPDLAALLKPRVDRLGYLGEFFKVTGQLPDVLMHFYKLTDALKDALPDKITETVALTIAARTGNAYERHQHERLSLKLGFSETWIRAVLALEPEKQAALDEAEKASQRLALSLLARYGRDCAKELQALVDAAGPQTAVGVLMLAGRYVTHAMTVNALELAPPVPSPLGAKP